MYAIYFSVESKIGSRNSNSVTDSKKSLPFSSRKDQLFWMALYILGSVAATPLSNIGSTAVLDLSD